MPSKDPARRNQVMADYYARNREKKAAQQRARAHALKAEVMAAYGGECVCCGETEPIFLTIDHVGAVAPPTHLRKNPNRGRKRQASTQIYRCIKAEGFPPDLYRVLCFNCNFAEYHGRCPHKRPLATA